MPQNNIGKMQPLMIADKNRVENKRTWNYELGKLIIESLSHSSL